MRWMVLLLFGSLGLGALGGGLWWGAQRYEIVRDGVLADGLVVEQAEHQTTKTEGRNRTYRRNVTGYYPVVEFRGEDGRTWRVEGTTGGGGAPILATGTEVSVLYPPEDPGQAVIVEFRQAWLGPLVLTVAGALFLLLGVGGFVMIGRSDRHFEELHQTLRRDALAFHEDTVRIQATITHLRPAPCDDADGWVFVCKGLRPGERLASEFQSEPFRFEPELSFVGRSVQVDLDPADRDSYRVELGGLLEEVLARRG